MFYGYDYQLQLQTNRQVQCKLQATLEMKIDFFKESLLGKLSKMICKKSYGIFNMFGEGGGASHKGKNKSV